MEVGNVLLFPWTAASGIGRAGTAARAARAPVSVARAVAIVKAAAGAAGVVRGVAVPGPGSPPRAVRWLVAAGLCAAAALPAGAGAATVAVAAPADPYRAITVATWGGPYEESQLRAYFAPFTERTGIRIETERYAGGLEELRRQVKAGDIAWNLVDMTMADNRAACRQGLLEPLDHSQLHPAPDGTPAAGDFIDGALTECGVAQIVHSMVAGYNRNAFPGERPTRIGDLFDLQRFPGKRALHRGPEANLEWALRSYGVPRQDLYQLLSTKRGLRLAFARLDRIRDQVVWWTSMDQPVQMLISGEAVFASQYNGRLFDAAAVQGHPIEIIWDGQIYELGTWGIPRGTRRRDDVLEFLRFATGTHPLAEQARYIAYGPARRSSMKLVSTHAETGVDMRPHLPTSPANFRTAIRKDTEWYASLYDRIKSRFDAWLAE
ncbi:MAG: extracellular solute-binding protein [Immundisolibacterales bacterium]|nr:extracellular solute-binding protein [Immundisolibacterales bacterium]